MRHLRLAFDHSFWELAEGLAEALPDSSDTDEGFHEPLCFQDLIEINVPGHDASVLFFPDADFPPEIEPAPEVEELLRCEESFEDIEAALDAEPAEVHGSHFSALELDYPEEPGYDCSACDFHKQKLSNPDAVCALCYMRRTAFAVYGK